jgi:hypothetical protein
MRPRARVFISYASEDAKAAQELCDGLLGAGYGVWFDRLCLLPGQDWEYEINSAVSEADVLIFLVSQRSAGKTGFVQRELRMALDAADERPDGEIFLIPVRLDEAPIPLRIRRWQWIDMRASDWLSRIRFSVNTVEPEIIGAGVKQTVEPPGKVDILGVEVAPIHAGPQEQITLDYVIRHASGGRALVQLGASLLSEDGYEYFDQSGDRRLWLRPGTAAYRRPLRIPAGAPAGSYRLVAAVWQETVGKQCLAVVDRGVVLELTDH